MKMKLLKMAVLLNVLVFFSAACVMAADSATASDASRPVYKHYLKIQNALAADSLKDVDESAAALAKTVRESPGQRWPDRLASQSDALAKATNLASAREAFKLLSKSLIEHWAAHEDVGGQYQRAYCPMAKAAWLQTGSEIRNPYFGKAMLNCGTFLPRAQTQASTPAACPANPEMSCAGDETMNCAGGQANCCAK